jgi:L-aspartate oxidase
MSSTAPIVIVGGGLAGVFCALKLAPLPMTVLAPLGVGQSGSSYWAQGGVAAAVEEGDTAEIHAADTVAAGAGTVDAEIALGMAREARARVEDLAAYGVPFDRSAAGVFQPSREAAHSHRRIVRVKGDTAGRAIMDALALQVAATPSIKVVDGFGAEDIVMAGGRPIGVRARAATGETRIFPCAALVLATGGVGHLYRLTTNPAEACGVGVAMAARAGALIGDAEFVQFHPTAIDVGVDPAPLATESLRGEGAVIIDRDGRRFMLDVDPAAELAPRDIVTRGVFASIAAGRGAFLDARAAVGAKFAERFPTVYASCIAVGVDPVTQPIPIAPAAHYHMGGVWTDARGRTSLDGLWAIGEVASTGVHGANRLASNSLLEAIVFGARVAADIAAATLASTVTPAPVHDNAQQTPERAIEEELRDTMTNRVGVIRDATGLAQALRTIRDLLSIARTPQSRNMLTTALLIASAAYARRESRGGHFRADYPHADPAKANRSRFALEDAERIAQEATSA